MNVRAFLRRKKNSHKGDFGKILIVTGSRGMSGAAALTGLAALRSGAGLVTLIVPDAVYPRVAKSDFELMVLPLASTSSGALHFKNFKKIMSVLEKQDVLAFGPGLSRDASTVRLVRQLLGATPVPTVVDADALNALEGCPQVLLQAQAPLILTPHEGEFQRIDSRKPVTAAERKRFAREFAEKFGVYLVLKGSRTVVASPDGKVYLNQTGNPGMATAGSGDVLTGVLAGLLGRKQDLFETVSLAVRAHGLAGDLAAKKTGQTALIARDILEMLPAVFKKLEKRKYV